MEALKLEFSEYCGMSLQSEYFHNLPSMNFMEFGILFINKKKRGKHFGLFKNMLQHFSVFQESMDTSFNTNDIGKEEMDRFVDYLLIEKKLKTSTVKAMIMRLKYLLEKAYLNGWAIDDSYSDAKVKEVDSTFIYLKEKEVARIYYYGGLTKKQEEIRDIFIIGCMTGQRYSDYSRITRDNIVGDNIHILQKKTRNKAVIPLTDYVREIFDKYNCILPRPRCIQCFNKSIKQICRKIGLTELVIFEQEIGGEIVTVKKPKYEMISSHTARRTFATNMIRYGVTGSKIRKCTGHKSTACFDRYDRMTLVDNARSLSGNGYLS